MATGTGFGAAVGVGLIYLMATTAVVFLVILLVKAVRRNKPAA